MAYRKYYEKNPSQPKRRWFSPLGIIFFLIVLVFFGFVNAVVSTIPSLTNAAFFFGVGFDILALVGFLILLHRGVLAITGRLNRPASSRARAMATQVNADKHGCKCYMEGLTPGEQEIAETLSRELSYKDYFIFNNIIIPTDHNGSTQIDHIVVSRFGVFVIESKDFAGWIFGSKNEEHWTQSLPGGKKKFQFENPIHQNYAHIMALKALQPGLGNNFINIVVFGSRARIKGVPMPNVVHLDHLIGTIKNHSEVRLGDAAVQLLIGKLSYACQTVDITAAQHVENLTKKHPHLLPYHPVDVVHPRSVYSAS